MHLSDALSSRDYFSVSSDEERSSSTQLRRTLEFNIRTFDFCIKATGVSRLCIGGVIRLGDLSPLDEEDGMIEAGKIYNWSRIQYADHAWWLGQHDEGVELDCPAMWPLFVSINC